MYLRDFDDFFDKHYSLNYIKLQNILYYCSGIYLVKHSKPLLNAPFKLTEYGVALDAVMNKYSFYSGADIPVDYKRTQFCKSILPEYIQVFVEGIWQQLKHYDSITLKKISNNKNGPIQKALQANRTELSNEDIKAYFASEIDKGNNW